MINQLNSINQYRRLSSLWRTVIMVVFQILIALAIFKVISYSAFFLVVEGILLFIILNKLIIKGIFKFKSNNYEIRFKHFNDPMNRRGNLIIGILSMVVGFFLVDSPFKFAMIMLFTIGFTEVVNGLIIIPGAFIEVHNDRIYSTELKTGIPLLELTDIEINENELIFTCRDSMKKFIKNFRSFKPDRDRMEAFFKSFAEKFNFELKVQP